MGANSIVYESSMEARALEEQKALQDELKQKIQNKDRFNAVKQKWYFIKFQTFCKTDPNEYGDVTYVLAEVCILLTNLI